MQAAIDPMASTTPEPPEADISGTNASGTNKVLQQDPGAATRIMNNSFVAMHLRSYMMVMGGSAAGAAGATGITGLFFFVVSSVLFSSALLAKCGFQPSKYYSKPTRQIWLSALTDRNSILSFILFWALLHSIINLF